MLMYSYDVLNKILQCCQSISPLLLTPYLKRKPGWLLLMIIMVSNEINDGGEIMVCYYTES